MPQNQLVNINFSLWCSEYGKYLGSRQGVGVYMYIYIYCIMIGKLCNKSYIAELLTMHR